MLPDPDFKGPVPINAQITDWIKNNIISGAWPENHQLKSETDLAKELSVSRGTIRKAIESLLHEGLLIRVHGKGTFVKTNLVFEQHPDWRLVGFSRDLISRGIPFSTEVLLNEIVVPPPEIARLLSLGQNDTIFHMRRLRKVHQKPVLMIENHVVYNFCSGIEKIDFSKSQLYTTLEEIFGFDLDWARRTYKAQTADKDIATTLTIGVGAPIMYLEELYHLVGDIPIEYTKAWINAEIFHITTTIKREDEKRDTPGIYR